MHLTPEIRNGLDKFTSEYSFILATGGRVSSIGTCSTWNGVECGAADTVDVGRGLGSCNSNLDCPCCAPYCSKEGFCQKGINNPAISGMPITAVNDDKILLSKNPTSFCLIQ